VNPFLLAAAFDDRRNSAVGLKLTGIIVTIPLRTQGAKQTRAKNTAGAGQTFINKRIRMFLKQDMNLFIILLDCAVGQSNLLG
jgi:hypothetical protein